MTMQTDMMQAQALLSQTQTAPDIAAKAAQAGRQSIQQIRKVAEDFESFYLSQMLQPMFQNLGAEEPFGGGPGEDIWRQFQVEEFGKAMAKTGGVGVADMVMKEMLKMQEIQQ